MATFPAIKPNTRSLTLGDYPQSSYVGPSGVGVRFLQNTKRVQHKLSLFYNSISEANVNLILNHYSGQEGTLIPFDLPAEVWTGYNTIPVSTVDYEWRYASAFSVEPNTPGRFNVNIELESVIV